MFPNTCVGICLAGALVCILCGSLCWSACVRRWLGGWLGVRASVCDTRCVFAWVGWLLLFGLACACLRLRFVVRVASFALVFLCFRVQSNICVVVLHMPLHIIHINLIVWKMT